jgi:two-component system sensor kinase FixL
MALPPPKPRFDLKLSHLAQPGRIQPKSRSIRVSSAPGIESALEFRSVTQSIDEAIVVSDVKGNIIFWNKGAERIFGYAEKQILGKPLALLLPIRTSSLHGDKLEHRLFSKASPMDGKTHELRGIRASGKKFPVEVSLLTWSFANKVFFTTIIRDMTERKRLQKEILDISGREQQRIGQDLHDGLCQHLTAITLLTEVLGKKLVDEMRPEAAADAAEIAKLVTQAIVHTKSLVKGLVPVEIEAQGLMGALQEMAAHANRLPHISCRMKIGKPVLVKNDAMAVHLYRIAQEAVGNALQHAHAKHITISLLQSDGFITLTITDDGIGIPRIASNHVGLGLSIMHSRADTMNGSLRIKRGLHGGTVIVCSVASTPKKDHSLQWPGRRRHENPLAA